MILWSHPDYPLLLPLNVARVWALLGERSVLAPVILGLLFQLSLVGLLATSVRLQRGALQGLLAGGMGIAVLFVSLNFRQYADIPLAYFFLAANVLLFMGDTPARKGPGPALLAGLMTGAALWTKNEGWALLVADHRSQAAARPGQPQAPGARGPLVWLLPARAAAALTGGCILQARPGASQRHRRGIEHGCHQEQAGRSLPLSDHFQSRPQPIYPLRQPGVARHPPAWGMGMLPLLLGYGVLVGISFPKEQRRAILALLLRVVIVAGVYFMIYLLTPNNLAWQLNTSLDRLVTQILPSALFLFFLTVSSLNPQSGQSVLNEETD